MSSQNAISVKNVSKKYRLFSSPQERLLEALHPFQRKYHKEFWALKDVSFNIPKGSTAGIMGRNGSGKSTLLKIIFSVLQQTSGAVTVDGRISALLELGAGFNPEFTGRKNIIFNGVVNGFSKEEMKKRMPLIEEFADIGDFIEQPVKTYSSGMFVRLAFAAAINIDPDVLIIDEALSVGDAKFQHKCFNKFIEFQKNGKTILFVSHSTDTIIKHCDHAILLDGGKVIEQGHPRAISNYYMDLLFTGKLAGYSREPVLVEEGYNGYNIVHYGMKHYVFHNSFGSLDLSVTNEQEIQKLVDEGKCVIADSLEAAKEKIRELDPEAQASKKQTDVAAKRPANVDVEKFLAENPETDICVNRKNYNKNEHRSGDRRAEIIDYLVVVGDRSDAVNLCSGDIVEIYMKVRFKESVDLPMFGFAITTVDGIMIYGSNTRLAKIQVYPSVSGGVEVIKWTIIFNLNSGDYFINLGVAEQKGIDVPIDNRKGLIHLNIQAKDDFTGFVALETKYERITAIPV